jgi:succinoglycan biosynthesis protein ExoV
MEANKMKLNYCRINNFGDAINPLVFNTLLPDFFDDNEGTEFIGIGSLLGLDTLLTAPKKIIFSTGFAYGHPAIIDDTYDIVCVRGPLTAKAIGVDKNLAVADGAILLNQITPTQIDKAYNISMMPHWESANKFRWDIVCNSLDINYINPQDNVNHIISEIGASRMLISEAMHGAIVADALRVPWIPLVAYRYINSYKWYDWTSSMGLQYKRRYLPSLYDDRVFTGKTAVNFLEKMNIKNTAKMAKVLKTINSILVLPIVLKRMQSICKSTAFLSDDKILAYKVDALLSLLHSVYKKYAAE